MYSKVCCTSNSNKYCEPYNVSTNYICNLAKYPWNVWSCSAQSCLDRFIRLFGSFERIRAMTQGDWKLPDDDICGMLFYYAVWKIYIVTSLINLRELFIWTASNMSSIELFTHVHSEFNNDVKILDESDQKSCSFEQLVCFYFYLSKKESYSILSG